MSGLGSDWASLRSGGIRHWTPPRKIFGEFAMSDVPDTPTEPEPVTEAASDAAAVFGNESADTDQRMALGV